MATIGNIYDYINSIAPFDAQMDFDNSGLLIGSRDRDVLRVMLALDATVSVAEQAAAACCQLLITHHPVIFHPAKAISADSAVYRLISGGVNVISAHTNYDIAEGGVNSCLAGVLGFAGFSRPEWLEIGVAGELGGEMTAMQLGQLVSDRLGVAGVKVTDGGSPIRRVVIIGGSGGGEVRSLIGKADALITGEAGHHDLLDARDGGLTVITAGHYETEIVAMPPLAQRLAIQFPRVHFVMAKEQSPTAVISRPEAEVTAAAEMPTAQESRREPFGKRGKPSYPKPPVVQ